MGRPGRPGGGRSIRKDRGEGDDRNVAMNTPAAMYYASSDGGGKAARTNSGISGRSPSAGGVFAAAARRNASEDGAVPSLTNRKSSGTNSMREQSGHMSVQGAVGVAAGLAKSSLRKEADSAVAVTEKQLTQYRVAAFLVALVGVITSMVEAEILYMNENHPTATVHALKAFTTATTVILLFVLTMQYRGELLVAKLRGYLDDYETLWSSGMGTLYICEIAFCALHSPVGVNYELTIYNLEFPITYSLDAVMSVVVLGRIYLFARVFDDFAGFRSTNADVVARWNDVSFDTSFTFKTMMEQHPVSFIFSLLAFSIASCAYALRVAEQPVCAIWNGIIHDNCAQQRTFNHYTNAVWNIFITMTTVGYGDTFPVTHAGRMVAVVACLVGLVLVALLVTVVTNGSEFTPDEQRAFSALVKSITRQNLRHGAAIMIQRTWAYYKYRLRLLYPNDDILFPTGDLMPPPDPENVDQSYREISGIFSVPVDSARPGRGNEPKVQIVPEGYYELLASIKAWRKVNADVRDAEKAKSEASYAIKEILDVRNRMNEISEALAHYMAQQDAVLPNIWAQLRLVSDHLGVPDVSMPERVLIDPTLAPNVSGTSARVAITLPRYRIDPMAKSPVIRRGTLTPCQITVEHKHSFMTHGERVRRSSLAREHREGSPPTPQSRKKPRDNSEGAKVTFTNNTTPAASRTISEQIIRSDTPVLQNPSTQLSATMNAREWSAAIATNRGNVNNNNIVAIPSSAGHGDQFEQDGDSLLPASNSADGRDDHSNGSVSHPPDTVRSTSSNAHLPAPPSRELSGTDGSTTLPPVHGIPGQSGESPQRHHFTGAASAAATTHALAKLLGPRSKRATSNGPLPPIIDGSARPSPPPKSVKKKRKGRRSSVEKTASDSKKTPEATRSSSEATKHQPTDLSWRH